MKVEDFFELKISDTIYYNGKKQIISGLTCLEGEYCIIYLDGNSTGIIWEVECKDFSLKEPLPQVLKRQFYQWCIGDKAGAYFPMIPLDENGRTTKGVLHIPCWDMLDKKKVGDFIWEE